jgi:dienelactone hydrolase
MRNRVVYWLRPSILGLSLALATSYGFAQALGEADRASPGDAMIQGYLERESAKLSAKFRDDLVSRQAWEAKRPQYVREYFYMLGLDPLPEKTPLHATTTSRLDRGDYVVEMIHYQSRPGLYVTGNLYRPAKTNPGERLPAVFYVCGHSDRGRNGNKTAYQSHGIWFARHGYVCLTVDSLQLGEIAAIHHGTYRLQRWWWHARGYTPSGVEAWNGIRGIDYLTGRADVDPQRIAVTGISGGGAATFWIAAADERVRVAVPVSGMADLDSYVASRTINGHCDCMFLYNTFEWPWTRIAGLVAPRPLLFVNSDQDSIFPMDANERIATRLERLYSLHAAGDRFDAVVSVGGHAYRRDIRQAAYRFINIHLKGDGREVADSEVDLVSEGRDPGAYPIAPEKLRVFPNDADLPRDQTNTKIDEQFVPLAKPQPPAAGQFDAWRQRLFAEIKQVSLRYFPPNIEAAKKLGDVDEQTERVGSEQGIEFRLRYLAGGKGDAPASIMLVVLNEDEAGATPAWLERAADAKRQAVVMCEPRGVGATRWTKKNPPNYVERSHALLGRTVDAGRIWDVVAAAKYLAANSRLSSGKTAPSVQVAGSGAAGVIGAYAALLNRDIAAATLVAPPASQMSDRAPQLLNVLRVCDIPDVLGMLAPRPLTLVDAKPDEFAHTSSAYAAANAKGQLQFTSPKK